MSERTPTSPAGVESVSGWSGDTAGAILRSARLASGFDLDTLASLLKVSTRKLEQLEGDQYDQLPGMAFVRSLALSVCRQLQIDAQPVLTLLPAAEMPPAALEHVTRGLATPFREPNTRVDLLRKWPDWLRPSVIAPAMLLLLALAFWLMPASRSLFGPAAVSPAASAVGGAASDAVAITPISTVTIEPNGSGAASQIVQAASAVASAVVETVYSVPAEDPAASPPASPAAAGPVVLRPTAESWVEARDGGGVVMLSRTVLAGEVIGLDGTPPFKLKIGNADTMHLSYRGQRIDLAPYTRDSVARLELK